MFRPRKPTPLPVPNPPPKRNLTPPPKRDAFTLESKTPTKNVNLAVYSALLGCFDQMTPDQRMRFVDFAAGRALLELPPRLFDGGAAAAPHRVPSGYPAVLVFSFDEQVHGREDSTTERKNP